MLYFFRNSFSLIMVVVSVLSFWGCDKNEVIPLVEIKVGDYPTSYSKEGGAFLVDVEYDKPVRLCTYGEELEGTDFIRTSIAGDTLESNWYRAIISNEKKKTLSVQIYPNETKLPREGYFYLSGTPENSVAKIAFSQSER